MYVCKDCHYKDKDVVECTIPIELHETFDEEEEGPKRCTVCGKWCDELYYCYAYEDYRWQQEIKRKME